MEKFSSPFTEIPVGKTKIQVTEPDRPLLWPHREFYKGFKGKASSRKPGQPGQTGSYEEALSSDLIVLEKARSFWRKTLRNETIAQVNDLERLRLEVFWRVN